MLGIFAHKKTPACGHAGVLAFYGGDACESNTPETLCTPHNGFEGRGAHQDPFISVWLLPSSEFNSIAALGVRHGKCA